MTSILVAAMVFVAFWFGVFFRGFDQPLFAPALVLVLLTGFILLLPGWKAGWSFPATCSAAFLAAFWLWMGISLSWSHVEQVSMIFCLTIGALPLLFFAVAQNPNREQIIRYLWVGMAGAISILAIWAVIQFLFFRDMTGSRIHHPMLNANNLAVILSMGFFLVLPLFMQAKTFGQCLYGFLLLLIVVGIMATQSRGGMLGLLIGAGTFGILCRSAVKSRWMAFTVLIPVVVIAVAAMLLDSSVESASGAVRLMGGADAAASVANRAQLWKAGFEMLKANPFPGVGLGVFYLTFPPFRDAGDLSDGYFLHVDPLQFGIELSIVAMVLFYGFALCLFLRMINAVRACPVGDDRRPMLVAGFAGLMSLMLNTHVNFDLYMLPALLLGGVLLLGWYDRTESILGAQRLTLTLRNRSHLVFIVPVVVCLFLAAPIWVLRTGIGVQDSALSAAALRNGDMVKARAYAEHGLKYSPKNYYYIYYTDALWRGKILQEKYDQLLPEAKRSLFDDAMRQINKSLAYNPYYVQAMSHKALLYYRGYPELDPDGYTHAVETLRHAVDIDPINFDNRMGLAHMLVLKGDVPGAIAALEDGNYWAVTQKYAPSAYIELLANLKQRNGQPDEAETLHQAAKIRTEQFKKRRESLSGFDSFIDKKMDALLHR